MVTKTQLLRRYNDKDVIVDNNNALMSPSRKKQLGLLSESS